MLVAGLEAVRVWSDPVVNACCAGVGCGLGIPGSESYLATQRLKELRPCLGLPSKGAGLSGSESGIWLWSSEKEEDANSCSDSREYPGRSTEVEAEEDLCLITATFRFDENSEVPIRKVSGSLRPCLGVGSPLLSAEDVNAVLGLAKGSVIRIRAGVAGAACPAVFEFLRIERSGPWPFAGYVPGGVSEPSRDKDEICGAVAWSGESPWC